MIGKLMLSFSAILLTAALGLAIGQQKPEQKPEQKAEETSEQKAAKVRTGQVVTVDASTNAITIKDDAGVETRVLTDTLTKITKAGKSITFADVKVGDKISSECAESSDGCKAKTIQVMPADPGN